MRHVSSIGTCHVSRRMSPSPLALTCYKQVTTPEAIASLPAHAPCNSTTRVTVRAFTGHVTAARKQLSSWPPFVLALCSLLRLVLAASVLSLGLVLFKCRMIVVQFSILVQCYFSCLLWQCCGSVASVSSSDGGRMQTEVTFAAAECLNL